jgi:signal transduction histidine kinase
MAAGKEVADVPRPPLVYRLTAGQWRAIDVAASVLAAGVVVFDFRLFHGLRILHGPRYQVPSLPVALLSLAATLPVGVRRGWPVPVLAELAILAGLIAAAASSHGQADTTHSMLAAGAMWFVGYGVRERRRYLAEEQAQRERAEAERGRLAVREERVRIARELHDVVAHTLSVVTFQAGIGRKVGASRPAEALLARNCGASSGCCATTRRSSPAWPRRQVWATWATWPIPCGRRGYRSR